jgi:large subunit ribosomal protein L4
MPLQIDVQNTQGDKVGSVDLPDAVFAVKGSLALVHEVINALQANRRRGTHSTKTRGEVSGGGVKPWKQKHTGNARAGSNRSPLWRHGGIIFGPKPRSYVQPVSATKKKLSLKIILSRFARDARVKALDVFAVSEPKTRRVVEIMKQLKWPAKTTVVVDTLDAVVSRAARNVQGLRFCPARQLDSYGAMESSQLVFTRPGLDALVQRLTGPGTEN